MLCPSLPPCLEVGDHPFAAPRVFHRRGLFPALSSSCVLPRPLPRSLFVLASVGFVDVCDLGYQGIIRIRVGEHRADGKENYTRQSRVNDLRDKSHTFRDGQSRAPLVTQYV
jgi:hypothetical protein